MSPADPRHGSYAGAVAHHAERSILCQPCRDAKRVYSRRYNKLRKMGHEYRIDPTLIRRHINRLMRAGMTQADIARAAGVHDETIRAIRVGEVDGILRKTFETIARVTYTTSETYMPREIAARKIKALIADGHEAKSLAVALGISAPAMSNILHDYKRGQTMVRRATWDAISDLFDELTDTPGASNRARNSARRNGWAPSAAWLDIEDPNDQPDPGYVAVGRSHDEIDTVIVDRIFEGDMSLAKSATKAEKVEIVRRWRRAGKSLNELDRLSGWQARRYFGSGAA